MKYTDTQVVFEEIPDEVTLCINVSNCPFRCPECHSKHLWDDIGDELDEAAIDFLMSRNRGVSCVCFMGHGGRSGWKEIGGYAGYIKEKYEGVKVALFSGADSLPLDEMTVFDYVKVGPYRPESGPLNLPGTNQRMYMNTVDGWEDITRYYQAKR